MVPFKAPAGCDPATGADLGAGLPVDRQAATVVDFFGRDDDSRILIEMLVQAVFETGPGGWVTEVSPTWLAYTGQSAEEVLGHGWIAAIHPDDRPLVAAAREVATETRTPLNGEYRLRRADGSWCWTNVRAVPVFDAAGEIVKWVGMNIDISARRDAEAKLAESEADHAHAVELKHHMTWTAAPDGRILTVNDRWCRFSGQEREAAIAAPLEAFAHPDDVPAAHAAFVRCMKSGDPYDVRFRVRTPDQGDRWVRSRAWPRRDETGQILRWYGFTEDIHDSVIAEAELRDAEERYRLAAEATEDVIWDFDIASGVVTWSSALERHFGYELEGNRIDKRWWVERIHPDDRARIVERSTVIMEGRGEAERWTNEYRFRRADGDYAHVLDCGHLVRDAHGKPVRAIGAMLDLTDKRRAEEEARVHAERLRYAVTASGLGISDYDARKGTLHWSDQMRAILGVDPDEPPNPLTTQSLVHPDDRTEVADHQRRAARGDFRHQYRGTRRIYRKNDGALRWVSTQGHFIRDEAGKLIRIIITLKDVTEEKAAQDRLQWTATHDAVTGLPNRAAFQTALDTALAGAMTRRQPLSLLLVDLDNFKTINDNHGHHAGDRVLQTFGDRIGAALPPGAVLARFGGAEFAVVLPDIAPAAAEVLAGEMLELFRAPFALDGASLDLRASVGVAGFPEHATDAEELVKSADIALYSAKGGGRATVRMFEPAMRATLRDHASMLNQARTVIDNDWTQPFYQPKIAFASGRVMGFESLFRWRHPQAGLQSPATIASAFDDIELAAVLGEAMVEAVLGDVRRWMDAGIEVGRVAINASAAEFRNPGYAERLLKRLAAHGVPGTALELEITETAFLGDSDGHVLHALETLRAAGTTIALDDFGTGFSSLAHLRHFPVDTLKIDQSFVAGIGDRADDRAIVEVVLRLGEALGLTTVAEGVETEAQAAFLRGRGCKLAQGYLFARPLPAEDVAAYLSGRGAERRRANG
jgi:diguanylate cyclase (GGDEF)-like protein/PAS domain S-box-containing protein